MESKPVIAVVTYNELFPYGIGIRNIETIPVLFLPLSFNPKGPKSVLPCDTNWMELVKHTESLEHIIIFAGKESSGTLEIIELACTSFTSKKESLYFILCDHDQEKKEKILSLYGIKRNQYTVFSDGHLPCKEGPLLKGYMLDFIQNYK